VQDPCCPHLTAGYAPDVPNAERSDGRDEDCADCETKQGMLDLIEREISLSGKLSEEQRPGYGILRIGVPSTVR